MMFAGHHSEAMLLGIFNVSILHNLVHLLFGVAGFLGARTASGSRAYLIGGGAIYLVLWLYGLVIDKTSAVISTGPSTSIGPFGTIVTLREFCVVFWGLTVVESACRSTLKPFTEAELRPGSTRRRLGALILLRSRKAWA